MIVALIPAAGKSMRMGRPKLSLPLGERTVLEQVLAVLRGAGIERALVVVGPHVPELVPLTMNAGAHVLQLVEETPDMRATVERGLKWIEEAWRPTDADAWLLVPADHPTLDAAVVRELIRAFETDRTHSIFVPTFEGRRGHPTLIGWPHVSGIRQHAAGQGLNTYLRAHGAQTREVPTLNPEVLLDLDTPEDYERLARCLPS
jgi:molybdenum cofactor cytidylyltransferase